MEKLTEMRSFFNELASNYDERITGKTNGDMEGKQLVASFLPEHTKSLIDFGIGTGLELENIFVRFPNIEVVGLDIAENMLQMLKEKYSERNIRVYCENYLDYDFGREQFDAALSIKTLHHFNHEVKTDIYRKIHACLKPNGVYIECDKMATNQAQEDFYFAEYERIKREQGISDDQAYHYDTPCTVDNQREMLLSAGFREVREVWRRESMATFLPHEEEMLAILVAKKEERLNDGYSN